MSDLLADAIAATLKSINTLKYYVFYEGNLIETYIDELPNYQELPSGCYIRNAGGSWYRLFKDGSFIGTEYISEKVVPKTVKLTCLLWGIPLRSPIH